MTPDDLAFLARLVRRRAGIVLGESRRPLIERRLQPVMRRFGFKHTEALMRELRLGRESLAASVTEAMTVNETSFFRDQGLFRRLEREIFPVLIRRRAREKRLRVWSAACAAGQEAWSLAMMLGSLRLDGWSIELTATDLSGEAIARAERGHYSFCEVQRGLSPRDLEEWFLPDRGGHAVTPHLRHMVSFRRFNLLDSFGWLDDLDLVLCRNVLIYFDGPTAQSVLERMAEAMAPEGVLALGENDTIRPPADLFTDMAGGLYAKAGAAARRLPVAI